jgi:hypothetical protein
VQGRDLGDTIEKAVSFDRETCRWTILGEAAAVQLTEQRARVLAALRAEPDGLSVTEIIGRAQLPNRNAADLLLGRMVADAEIERVKRGLYGLPGTRSRLSTKKGRQKDRSPQKPPEPQEDSNLSHNLSRQPPATDCSPAGKAQSVTPTTRDRFATDCKGKDKLLNLQDNNFRSVNLSHVSKQTDSTSTPRSQKPLQRSVCSGVADSAPPMEEGREAPPSLGRCAQCNGLKTDAPFHSRLGVHLHDECMMSYWRTHHPEATPPPPPPRCGGRL